MVSGREFLIYICAVLLLLAMFFVPAPQGMAFFGSSSGGGGGGGTSFGGKAVVIPCLCSKNRLLTVGSPKGGMFILNGSQIFEAGDVSTGDWVLGLASGGSVCLQPGPKACATPIPIGAGPVVTIIGSS